MYVCVRVCVCVCVCVCLSKDTQQRGQGEGGGKEGERARKGREGRKEGRKEGGREGGRKREEGRRREGGREGGRVNKHRHLRRRHHNSGVIADLPLVVVPPGKHFPVLRAHDAVERPTGDVNHLLIAQVTQHLLWDALVGVVAMTKSVVISFPPKKVSIIIL